MTLVFWRWISIKFEQQRQWYPISGKLSWPDFAFNENFLLKWFCFLFLNEEWSCLGIISKGVFGQRVMCRFLFENSEMWNWSLIHVSLSPCPFIFVCQSENTISRSTCTSLNWTIILRVFLGCVGCYCRLYSVIDRFTVKRQL